MGAVARYFAALRRWLLHAGQATEAEYPAYLAARRSNRRVLIDRAVVRHQHMGEEGFLESLMLLATDSSLALMHSRSARQRCLRNHSALASVPSCNGRLNRSRRPCTSKITAAPLGSTK
jgi:hypothetical protein